jgi:hypothetical protein
MVQVPVKDSAAHALYQITKMSAAMNTIWLPDMSPVRPTLYSAEARRCHKFYTS